MFPSFCGAMGMAGWLLMLLVWAGLVALAVWGIARLFPDHPHEHRHGPVGLDATPATAQAQPVHPEHGQPQPGLSRPGSDVPQPPVVVDRR